MLAGIHAGILDPYCRYCERTPGMKLTSTCPSERLIPTALEEVDGVKVRYWSCPIKYVPDQIIYWYQLFDYEQTFPGCRVPSFQKRKRRYLKALAYYRSKKMEYTIIFQKRQIEKMKKEAGN